MTIGKPSRTAREGNVCPTEAGVRLFGERVAVTEQSKTEIATVLSAALLAVCCLVIGCGDSELLSDNGGDVRIQRPLESQPEPESTRLVVDLDAHGRILVKGKEYTLLELGEIIKRECPNDKPMTIRPSEKLHWDQVAPIVRAAAEAGVSDLSITALTEE